MTRTGRRAGVVCSCSRSRGWSSRLRACGRGVTRRRRYGSRATSRHVESIPHRARGRAGIHGHTARYRGGLHDDSARGAAARRPLRGTRPRRLRCSPKARRAPHTLANSSPPSRTSTARRLLPLRGRAPDLVVEPSQRMGRIRRAATDARRRRTSAVQVPRRADVRPQPAARHRRGLLGGRGRASAATTAAFLTGPVSPGAGAACLLSQDARLVAARDRMGDPADQDLRTVEVRGLPRYVCQPSRSSDTGADRSVHCLAGVPDRERRSCSAAANMATSPTPCSHFFETTLDEARTLADVFLSPTGGGTHQYSGIVIRNPEFDAIQPDASKGSSPTSASSPATHGRRTIAYVG